ncbi:MAG: recombination mediator RecR [Patescibacteria group bacterium]
MREFPPPIQNLAGLLQHLPGVGPKTAVRYVFHLLKQPKGTLKTIADAILKLQENIHPCAVCRTYATDEICETCKDPKRKRNIVAVVAHPRDVTTIQAAGFDGRFHVLGGTLSPLEGITPDVLEIASLISRLKNDNAITEVILAFNPDIEGETTIMYLSRALKQFPIKISRLARGLPVGSDLEFADEVTLGDALKRRWEI